MQGKGKEHWARLCEQAAFEQDSETLMGLINEINRMLDEKEQSLKDEEAAGKHSDQKSTASLNF